MLKPVRLTQLTQAQPIVDAQGRPASAFLRYFNDALSKIENAFNGIISAQNAANAAQSSADNAAQDASDAQTSASSAQTTADNALTVANSKLSQSMADSRYVRQSQTPTWSPATGTVDRTAYAAYVSPTISATPTQAEVQAVSDAVQSLSQHVAALLNDLAANNVLKS